MANAPITRRVGSRLSRFHDDMDELMGRFFGDWNIGEDFFHPALDIAEDKNAFTLKVDLPGVKAEDIDIQVHGNRLALSGRRDERKEKSEENYYHVERRSGMFRREVVLPVDVDSENIEAKHNDGVLTITLPKSERAKARKIEVKK